MIKEIQFINIREVLSRVLRHPLLLDISVESAIQYTLDFIGIIGLPDIYLDKQINIHIEDYSGALPCDIILIIQVRDCKSNMCMRSMTDTFLSKEELNVERTFKTQGLIIYTSFKTGDIEVSYKAIAVDKDGLPLLPDNSVFLKALEAYIKKEEFGILFDMGKVNNQVLQRAEQQYSWLAGLTRSEFTIPSISEMESITRMWNTLITGRHDFEKGFRDLGNKEHLKIQ